MAAFLLALTPHPTVARKRLSEGRFGRFQKFGSWTVIGYLAVVSGLILSCRDSRPQPVSPALVSETVGSTVAPSNASLDACESANWTAKKSERGMAEAYAKNFKLGVAMSSAQLAKPDSADAKLAAEQFVRVTAENAMKWENIQPEEGFFSFERAESLVHFAEQNKMEVHGHTLVWHQQTPKWVFEEAGGQPVTREVLLARVDAHMAALATQFAGRVAYWDVLNEGINDDGSLRDTPWLRIIGKDYIEKIFQLAAKHFPKAKLGYNDYSMTAAGRLRATVALVKRLRGKGIRIDSVGMQSHYLLDSPSVDEIRTTLAALVAAQVDVLVTELDVDVLPRRGQSANITDVQAAADPYQECLPEAIARQAAQRWVDIFRVFLEHQEAISSVTLWGLTDSQSWLNDFPVRGRTNYSLLFDRQLHAKRAWYRLMALASESRQ